MWAFNLSLSLVDALDNIAASHHLCFILKCCICLLLNDNIVLIITYRTVLNEKDRVELESLLIEVIDQVKHNRKIVQQINNVFREYGLPSGTFQSISRSKNEVYLLDVARLFVLTHALHITTNNNAISPFEYFTIKEIDQAKGYIKRQNRITSWNYLLYWITLSK